MTESPCESSTSVDEWGDDYADYARAVVLNEDKDKVLILQAGDTWDLPYFAYLTFIGDRAHKFCRDL